MSSAPAPTPGPTSGEEFNLWWLGVILGLLGSIAINSGNNLQSLGMHLLEDEERERLEAEKAALIKGNPLYNDPAKLQEYLLAEEEHVELVPSKSKTWVVGTCVFVSGSLLNFASFGFAATQLLASLEGIQFVTNLAFAKFVMGEEVSVRQVIGTVFIIIGVIVTVLFSSKSAQSFTTQDMIQLYSNFEYQMFLVVELIMLFVLHSIHVGYQKLMDAHEADPVNVQAPAFGLLVLQSTYATWSALFGTQSVVQAKCLAQLLGQQIDGNESIFEHWFTYTVLLAWLALTAVWLYRMNEALAKYNPLFMIPLLQINFIFFAILSGGVYFQEFDEFSVGMWIGFWSGVLIQFTGLALLAPPDAGDPEEDSLHESGHGGMRGGHLPLPSMDIPDDVELTPTPTVGEPPHVPPLPPPTPQGGEARSNPPLPAAAQAEESRDRGASEGELSATTTDEELGGARDRLGSEADEATGRLRTRSTSSDRSVEDARPRRRASLRQSISALGQAPKTVYRRGTFMHIDLDLPGGGGGGSDGNGEGGVPGGVTLRVPQVYSLSAHHNSSHREKKRRRQTIQRRRESLHSLGMLDRASEAGLGRSLSADGYAPPRGCMQEGIDEEEEGEGETRPTSMVELGTNDLALAHRPGPREHML